MLSNLLFTIKTGVHVYFNVIYLSLSSVQYILCVCVLIKFLQLSSFRRKERDSFELDSATFFGPRESMKRGWFTVKVYNIVIDSRANKNTCINDNHRQGQF